MAAKDRHTQTQEELQTNGDTNSPGDSNNHPVPLDQKVKDSQKEESAQAGLPGAALQTGATAYPFGLLTLHEETEGSKEKDLT